MAGVQNPLQTVAIFAGLPGAAPAQITLRKTGWRFRIRTPMDVWVIKETCLDEDYLWASGALQSDWNIVDIGAGLGDFTVYAAKHCSEGSVHAYEPLAESFALLQHNLSLNNIGNVRAFPVAAAAHKGTLTLAAREQEAVSQRFVNAGEGSQQVAAVTLEQVLATLPGATCDFMKIDCEGCEFDLLLNSPAEVVQRCRRISMEFHDRVLPHSGVELGQRLSELGFQVRMERNPVHDGLGFLYAEHLDGAAL